MPPSVISSHLSYEKSSVLKEIRHSCIVMTDAEVEIKCGIDKIKSACLPNSSNAVKTTREIFNATMNRIEQTVGTSAFLDSKGTNFDKNKRTLQRIKNKNNPTCIPE
jgi:hypothetical protein